ncbi:MAG: hypothetical protein IPG25_18950 [Proteobacteria bacterium]|nr:hypothetical protein [Pseudomonadota bacterium]
MRALQYFGGAPRAIVPDNLKSGVTKAHRYEPDLNLAYQEFAEHYNLAIYRPGKRKPRDKGEVETGVLDCRALDPGNDCATGCSFPWRHSNAAIAELIEYLNTRPFKLVGSRRSRFLELEQPRSAFATAARL